VISTITYDSGDGLGVSVGGISFVDGEEVVAVAVQLVDVAGAQDGSVIIPTRRQNKMYLLIVENLKRLTVGLSRKWAGVDSAKKPGKTQSREKAQKTRRIPLVG